MKKLDNPTQEELFDLWCDELVEAGFIKKVQKQNEAKTFTLGQETYCIRTSKKVLYKGTSRERIKVTTSKITIIPEVTYTPDRVIFWTDKAYYLFFKNTTDYIASEEEIPYVFLADCIMYDGNPVYVSYVDVKAPPGYGGRNNSDVSLSIKSKWVWNEYGTYINKVYNYPNKKVKNVNPYLWLKTFTPLRYFYTDKLTKRRTISNWKPRTLKEFLDYSITKSNSGS